VRLMDLSSEVEARCMPLHGIKTGCCHASTRSVLALQMVITASHALVLQSRQQKEEGLSRQVYNAEAAAKPRPQWIATMVSWGVPMGVADEYLVCHVAAQWVFHCMPCNGEC
jgi:hypothetical protein